MAFFRVFANNDVEGTPESDAFDIIVSRGEARVTGAGGNDLYELGSAGLNRIFADLTITDFNVGDRLQIDIRSEDLDYRTIQDAAAGIVPLAVSLTPRGRESLLFFEWTGDDIAEFTVRLPGRLAAGDFDISESILRFDESLTFTLVSGFAGPDARILDGTPAADVLRGTPGDDLISGGAGNDLLVGLAGADELEGGPGIDTASYIGSDEGVTVSVTAGFTAGGHARGDRLTSIENLTGSGHEDVLIGDAGANRLTGGGGDDLLLGLDGPDLLVGGPGGDTLRGGPGDDALIGGPGADVLSGGSGRDTFRSASANDGLDLVPDFDGQDVLRLDELLDGFGAGGDPAAFVRLVDDGVSTTVLANPDGRGDDFAPVVTLMGISGTSLDELLTAGQIVLGPAVVT